MRFFTSDTHFCHKNIIKYENRPFSSVDEMDKILICNWNAKVGKNDEVYHLGDFAFASPNKIHSVLDQLNGNIHLIWGNHDKEIKKNKYLQRRFVWCRDYYAINDATPIILFHYPIAVWDRKHYGSIHLYGHIHSDNENHHPLVIKLENAYNVGTDVCNFEPKTLEELINGTV